MPAEKQSEQLLFMDGDFGPLLGDLDRQAVFASNDLAHHFPVQVQLARGLVTLEQGIDDDGVLVHQCQRLLITVFQRRMGF